MDGSAALWLRNDCKYVGAIGSNGDFGTDQFQATSDDLAQHPQSLIGCEPRREVPSFIPQISLSEARFSFAIPGRRANANSLDQTVASIAAMMDCRRAILRCAPWSREGRVTGQPPAVALH